MNNITCFLTIITIFLLSACGGGGGDSANSISPPSANTNNPSPANTNKTVTAFALNNDGSKGAQLGTATADANGAYTISLGGYVGTVLVESYGGYTDVSTGLALTIPASAPLRAAVTNTSGTLLLTVTPLTDLAVRQAGTLTAQNITTANTRISDLFKVDIISTVPAAPTSSAFRSKTTTQAQRDYAMALAAISQMMQTNVTLDATLSTLNNGISPSGMNLQTAAAITAATNSFIANPKNNTGVTAITETSLSSVGTTSMKLTLVLQGSTASSVKGIQTTIALPAGVTVRADASGKVIEGVILPTSSTPAGIMDGKYTAAHTGTTATATLGFSTSGSMVTGDIIILIADLAAGTTTSAVSAFALNSSKLVDADGNSVSGMSLVLR